MQDNATAKKVPGIPGLLEYRQDEKKLYLRANKTWNLLTQEKEVMKYIHHIHILLPIFAVSCLTSKYVKTQHHTFNFTVCPEGRSKKFGSAGQIITFGPQ